MKIGIDIGGSHIASGIVLDKGKLVGKETRDIDVSSINNEKRAQNIILETIIGEIKILLERHDYSTKEISKIGIAVPGSPSKKCIRRLVNLHIKNFNIADELNKIYKTKIIIKNDGKCAGIAEKRYGALKEFDDCVFLCMGTGVGSAVFLNGKLLEPSKNPGFEFGHMIIEKKGIKCNCGNSGCYETYASMKRFKIKAIKSLRLSKDTQSEELQNYIRNNIKKPLVNKFINEYLDNVCIGLANISNIFEPQAICFGGSFSYYSDIFLPILEQKLTQYKFNKDSKIKLLSAKLKNDAGIIGATEL
ncbi:MAG: ROK family protein [Clostridia bacterium]|nr:ROK family protein [Clostridia bacterium]